MKDEVSQGISNALERGETLESAIRSFVNAGYPESDVREAANVLTNSASMIVSKQQVTPEQIQTPSPAQSSVVPYPISSPQVKQFKEERVNDEQVHKIAGMAIPVFKPKEENKDGVSTGKVILLSVILFVLLIMLVASIFFKDSIASLFG